MDVILTTFYHNMRNVLFSYWGCGKFFIIISIPKRDWHTDRCKARYDARLYSYLLLRCLTIIMKLMEVSVDRDNNNNVMGTIRCSLRQSGVLDMWYLPAVTVYTCSWVNTFIGCMGGKQQTYTYKGWVDCLQISPYAPPPPTHNTMHWLIMLGWCKALGGGGASLCSQ